ncbi:MAG: HAD family phosphatase [Bacteroidota bacterium]|nr:HAD family phosphatase [Bacteroidota bacterium]
MLKLDNIKNIIFDLGGVVINLNVNLTTQAFVNFGFTDFNNMYTQLQQTELFNKLDKGLISPETFRNELRRYFSVNLSDEQIDQAWNAMLLDFPQENRKLIQQLSKQYRTFLLSNTNQIHLDYYFRFLKQQYGMDHFEGLFEKTYYSNEVGMRKPDQKIFEFVLNDSKLKASETLFIDDNLSNVEGAKKAGIQAYHLQKGENIQNIFSPVFANQA